MLNAVELYSYAQNFRDAYSVVMKPLCDELGMTQSAVDILMFLANNPGQDTSSDIKDYLHMKQGIISFHVDRLVEEGYLERGRSGADRRKCHLCCTQKAAGLIENGRRLQAKFYAGLIEGFAEEDIKRFAEALRAVGENIDRMIQEGKND